MPFLNFKFLTRWNSKCPKRFPHFNLKFMFTSCLQIISILTLLGSSPLHAENRIYIDVGQAQVRKSLMALPPLQFYGKPNAAHLKVGQEIFKALYNDLNVSNYFTFINPSAFLEDTNTIGLKPAPGEANGFHFTSWKTIGAEFLIRAGYQIKDQKTIHLETYLYSVPKAELIFGKIYEGPLSAERKIAHTYANDILEKLTGKKGMYTSKIVVATNKGGGKAKKIYVMDWDGANEKSISNTNTIHISPTWSRDGKKVAYTAYAYHTKQHTTNPDLFVYELATGKRWLVSYRKGMNSGADFFPDGKSLLLTLSVGGTPDIYKIGIDGKHATPLTHGPNKAMNVEPAISPDGKRIAFSSDRSGNPMIYVMPIGGGAAKRITIAGKYNASPAWSPDGKKIAFAGFDKDHFDIFIMNPDGTQMERLTDAKKKNGRPSDNESPSFSPDGRYILFTSNRTGTHQMFIISPDGKNEHQITYDRADYSKPKWSPDLD